MPYANNDERKEHDNIPAVREAKRLYQRNRYRNNVNGCRDKILAYNRKRSYGVDQEMFDLMLDMQDRRCANPGCKTANPKGRGFCLDHDHNTNRVRGILCAGCNLAIGHARESETVLFGAIDYLRKYRYA